MTSGRKLRTRRLGRHLFTAVSALSLLLCVLAAGLWVRQRYASDQWGRIGLGVRPTPAANGDVNYRLFYSGHGRLQFAVTTHWFRYTGVSSAWPWDRVGTGSDTGGWYHLTRPVGTAPGVPVGRPPDEQVTYYTPVRLSRWGLYAIAYRLDAHNGSVWSESLVGVPTWSCLMFAVLPALSLASRQHHRLGRRRCDRAVRPDPDVRAGPGLSAGCRVGTRTSGRLSTPGEFHPEWRK